MTQRIKLFFAFLLVSMAATAQSVNIEFEEYTLDNGLHVILHEDKSTPIVAVTIMYHVGSKNEKPDRTGFAHFFEHLLFEGSENIDRGEFDKYVENAGGTLNANTSYDRTFYYELLPSNQLELGLWLESERLLHAKVENKGIETQREVVKEERRQRIDNQPYGTWIQEMFGRAFKGYSYEWPVIGYMEHLNAAEEEDYVNFYKTFYVPNNAVLSIAGDLDIPETKKMIEKYFGGIPRGTTEIPRPDKKVPELTGEQRATIYDNIQLPAVITGFRIPAEGTPDYYAVDMLSTLLAQGQSSRLYRSLVDEQQKALQIGAFPFGLEDSGINVVFALVNVGGDIDELETALQTEIGKVRNELIGEKEFQKLKNQIENDFVTGNSTVAARAESLANYHMYFGDANLINNEIERYMAVTREDIKRVANKYFVKGNSVTLQFLPKSMEP